MSPINALTFPRRSVFKKSQSHIPYLRTVPGTWHQLISTRLACLIVLFATLIVSVIGGYFSSSVPPIVPVLPIAIVGWWARGDFDEELYS
jgi:hypothetical protein